MHNALQIPDRWIIKGKSRTKKLFRWKKKEEQKEEGEKGLDDMTSKNEEGRNKKKR